jgi:hypothetical protein
MVAEGNVVTVRYTERGKSLKSFRGQPATNKSYEIVAMEWFIIENNRILVVGEHVILPRNFVRWKFQLVEGLFGLKKATLQRNKLRFPTLLDKNRNLRKPKNQNLYCFKFWLSQNS